MRELGQERCPLCKIMPKPLSQGCMLYEQQSRLIGSLSAQGGHAPWQHV